MATSGHREVEDNLTYGSTGFGMVEVEPRLREALPAGHYAFASLAAEKALIVLAKGDVAEALKLSEQAVAKAFDSDLKRCRGFRPAPARGSAPPHPRPGDDQRELPEEMTTRGITTEA